MKLLITGGCGFLGSNLAADSLTRGDELWVFDNLSRPGASANLEWLRGQGEFRFVHGDIRAVNDVERMLAECRPDAIFHLAGQVAMTTSVENPRRDFEVNALGTINVLEGARRHSPDAPIIYSSTNKVYGNLEWIAYSETETRYIATGFPDGFDEKIPLDFHSPYGCSKGTADAYMLDYARMYGMRTVVLRHSSMYGGRQYATYDQGWVGWFCLQAVHQSAGTLTEPVTVSGSGKQVRDLLHADDVKPLYLSALQHIDGARGQVFNIGGGMENSLSLLEFFRKLEQSEGLPLRYEKHPARTSDQKVFVADIRKAEQILRWSPRVTASEGIRRAVAWVREL